MSKKKEIPLADWMRERDEDVIKRAAGGRKLTRNHQAYQDAIYKYPIVISTGPAGTGKTSLACDVAVRLLKAGEIKKIVLTRPLVTCDEELGILPGTIEEKLKPYLAPLEHAIKAHLSLGEYERLMTSGVIEVCPLAVIRGRTFTDTVLIADEMQNANLSQIRNALTRLGFGSRFVLNGDITQSDLNSPNVPLAEALIRLAGCPGVKHIKFSRSDCLRPQLVQEIDRRLGGPV